MDDADQRLPRRQRADHFLADRLVPDRGDEVLDDRQRDVGLEQREPDLAQRVLDVGVGEACLAAQLLDDAGEPLGEIVEHRESARTPERKSAPRVNWRRRRTRRHRKPMILLHVAVAALYALAAWALWPQPVPRRPARRPRPRLRCEHGPRSWSRRRCSCHAFLAGREFATADGLDLSLPNAVSVVAALVALVAWASGLLRTLPAIGTVVLPVAAVACALARCW